MKQLTLLLLSLLPFSLLAQSLSGNVDYPELGISFTIPNGWVGQETESAVLMGSNTVAGYLIIMRNEATSVEQLKQEAQMGLNDQGVNLQLKGAIKTVSNQEIEATYEGSFNFESARCFGIAKIDGKGKGVTILALTTVEAFGESQINAARQLARSVQFKQERESTKSVQWKNQIGGRRLVYMHTSGGSDYGGGYSGISTKINIDLCNNGRFTYYMNDHTSFDGDGGFGYTNGKENGQGIWKVVSFQSGSGLVLNFDNGQVKEYSLSLNSKGQIMLNNTRYLRTEVQNCY